MNTTLRNTLPFWLILLVGVGLIYLPGLSHELVFDDYRLRDGTIFGGPYGSLTELKQRLISYGSFVWLDSLLGDGWWKQRLVNVLLHLGTAAGLLALTRGLINNTIWPAVGNGAQPDETSRNAAASVGVLLVALNPVAVYAVAYLIQRSILMATLFSVWALVLTLRAATGAKPGLLFGALLLYVLAVLSKEHAVLLPAPAIALYFISRRTNRGEILAVGAAGFALMGIGAAFLLDRYEHVLGAAFDANAVAFINELEALQPGIGEQAWLLSIVNQSWLFFKYGFLWVVPNIQWMSIDMRPPFPLGIGAFPQVLGLLLYPTVLAASLLLMVRFKDWRRVTGFALFTPCALFATEFATVWIQDPFVLYRSYLWAITLPLLLALPFIGARQRNIYAIGLVLCAGLVALSAERVNAMKTVFNVWDDAAAKIDVEAPANAVGRSRAFQNRGNQYMVMKQANVAIKDYEMAIRMGDLSGLSWFHLGNAFKVTGRFPQALEAYRKAEESDRKRVFGEQAKLSQAELLVELKRPAEALPLVEAALQKKLSDDHLGWALAIRARAATALGRRDVALNDYTRLVELEPSVRTHYLGLASVQVSLDLREDALKTLGALIDRDQDVDAYIGSALILRQLGRHDEALEKAEAARQRHPADRRLPGLIANLKQGAPQR